MKKNTKKIKRFNNVTIIGGIILLISLFLTVGYAAFMDQLAVTNAVAHVRKYELVRVNGVTTNSGSVSDLDYGKKSILNTVYISPGNSITYSVTATNLGNVPVAVTDVSFTDGTTPVGNLTANITPSNYVEICDTNDTCTNGVSKTFDVTITNNGSTAIEGNLDINLTFKTIYYVYYEKTKLPGKVFEGGTFTHTFTGTIPSKISVVEGECDPPSYSSGNLSISNVNSDIYLTEAHAIYYNNTTVLGYADDGGPYSYTFDKEWPATVTKDSGTSDSVNYVFSTHTLSLTNVKSDIYLTGTIGEVAIKRITYVSSKNVASHSNPSFSGMNVDFTVTFRKAEGSTEEDFEIVYEVELENTHYNDYIFRGFDFHPTITSSAESDTAQLTLTPVGVTNGEVIASGATKTFTVVLSLETNNPDGSYDTTGNAGVDTTPDTEEETGDITASVSPSTGSVRSNAKAQFTVTVNNTFPSDRTFTLSSSNSNLEIVNSSGNPIGELTVHGNSTETYTVYVKAVNGAQFVNNTDTMTMSLSSPGLAKVTVGNLTFDVDKYDVPDTEKVKVGNVQIDYYRTADGEPPEVGSVNVTWDRIDYGGTPISDYVVQLFRPGESTAAYTESETSSTRSYKFTNVAAGTYYAVVYGIDSASPPNTGVSSVSSATTADGFASKSGDASFKWEFAVDTSNVQNLTIAVVSPTTDKSKAYREQVYSITVTAKGQTGFGDNTAPTDLTVKLGETADTAVTLTKGTDYDYSRSSSGKVGTLKIKKGIINNNLFISGNHIEGCLIAGTKIKLADGTYKNIEDINYDDLLLVYNYENGDFAYEYPIWIEKATVTDKYQVNTFSDGTVLKTYGYHGVFETELNRFVSVDKPEEFHVGSKIAKLKEDGSGFETVEVTNIEYKNEYVVYYHVVSTRYYNIIANDLLTTDGTTVLSNLYGFTDKMTWPKEVREAAMQDVYTYNDLKDAIPYYMFKGLRAEEGKVLANYGLDLETFKGYLIKNQNNPDMLREPIKNNGKNMWMVTTSLDKINEFNKKEFLREEGSIYTLPKVNKKNFTGWLNYSDNKMYKPGENIVIYHGMHFEALYK